MRTAVLGFCAVLLVAAVAAAPSAAAPPAEPASWPMPLVRFEPQPGATIVVDGIGEMRGTVEVRRVGDGLAVINELPLEEYLLGLAEVPSTWPAAALEAQAIAARTFAVRSALTPSLAPHRVAGADICATQACQVYDGIERERRDAGGAWADAVRATANRVLLDRGVPILAKYASSNGGASEYGGHPYLPAVLDPDDAATSPYVSWQSVIPLAEVERALPGTGRLVEVNRAGDVVVLRREQPDGIVLDEGIAPLELRRALNRTVATPPGVPVPVPSHRFVARTEGDTVVLDGSGYGHLVGMSQYGALGKALRGMASDDILAAYYAGLRSTAVDPATLPAVLRVAVELDATEVVVRPSGGRFRVRAADGAAVAELTGGEWQVTPDGDVLRVAGHTRAIGLQAARIAANVVRLSLSAPARVEVDDPHRRAVGVLDVGEHEVLVGHTGPVAVVADAGGGRVERAEVGSAVVVRAARVAAPASGEAGPRGAAPTGRAGPAVVAAAAAAAVASAAERTRRDFRR